MTTIISGTNRPDNYTISIASLFSEMLTGLGVQNQVLDLRALPKDFAFNDLYDSKSPTFESIIRQYITEADKFIFIAPEYNGSIPGVLKTFIDGIPPKNWTDKKALLIGLSDGHAGNMRGLEHLTGILHYLKVHVHYNKTKLSYIGKSFDRNALQADDRTDQQLRRQAQYAAAY
jgi:NAD(P)H-dependent FMN reductase